jgi:lipid-A-disaccharide synthase
MTDGFLRVFVVAGEPSGDQIGGRLMAALREATGDRVRFAGVGGDAMTAQGLNSIFPMEELSLIGITEVLPHIPRLLKRIRQTAGAIDSMEPDVVVTIDSPSFAYAVIKRVRRSTAPKVHYVAPTVWAWRPWRVRKIKRYFDMMLALLPFEPPFFEKAGMPCRFVGHPVVEYQANEGDGAAFRERHGIAADDTVLCVLLGSRRGEVTRHADPFAGAVELLSRNHPSLRVVTPTVPGVSGLVQSLTADWAVPVTVVHDSGEKYAAMAASDAAIAASGTVALEISLARLPAVVAYRISNITAAILRLLLNVRYVNLVNLILDREVVPERLQFQCTAEILAGEVEKLLGKAGQEQIQAVDEALQQLGVGSVPPSRRAADAILDVVAAHQRASA